MSGAAASICSASIWPLTGRTGGSSGGAIPPMARDQAPAAITTTAAVTSVASASRTPITWSWVASTSVTAMCSRITTPAASAAARRAAASLRLSTWWSCGLKTAPANWPRCGSRRRASRPDIHSTGRPRPCWKLSPWRSRAASSAVGATTSVPSRRRSTAIPLAASSSAANCGHAAWARRPSMTRASSPGSASTFAASMPAAAWLAPAPATPLSNTVTVAPRCARRQAMPSPITPAPTMTTSREWAERVEAAIAAPYAGMTQTGSKGVISAARWRGTPGRAFIFASWGCGARPCAHRLAGGDLFLACQPDGAAAATRILGHVRHDLEAVLVEQGAIFVRRQARMVQRLAAKSADRLAVTRPAVEHERGSRRRMTAEDVEHGALSVLAQVEKAVPGKNAVELPVERQAPHVGHDPGSLRETAAAQCDHGGRGIHAAQFIAGFDEVARDGFARPAADVENFSAARQQGQEPVEPRPLEQAAPSFAIPGPRVAVVEIDDPFGIVGH